MKITSNRVTGLVVSLVVCAGLTAVAVPTLAAEKQTVSKAVGTPLKAAQAAMQGKRYPEALAKLKEVQAVSGKTPAEEHLMNEMLGFVYIKLNQLPEAVKVYEADLDSGQVSASERPKRVRQLITMHYQLKNYDKVLSYGDQAIKGGYADDDIYTWMGQSYYQKGDFKGAAKFIDGYVAGQIKAGKKPKEQPLVLIQNSCTRTNDGECLQRTLERLVSYYPKPQYWQSLVDAMYKGQTGDALLMQVYRLATAVDVLNRANDYTEYAQLALDAGSPGEAQLVLEKGFQKKVFTEARDVERNKRLLESAKKQVAASQAALPKTDAEAAAAPNGDKDVSVGLTYLGYQQYDKAAAAFNRGLAKPGVPDPNQARLMLGIAELGAGRKDEARKAFKQVKGNPTLERLANLWTLHAQA
jgi:TolA-binding protein